MDSLVGALVGMDAGLVLTALKGKSMSLISLQFWILDGIGYLASFKGKWEQCPRTQCQISTIFARRALLDFLCLHCDFQLHGFALM